MTEVYLIKIRNLTWSGNKSLPKETIEKVKSNLETVMGFHWKKGYIIVPGTDS